MSETKGDEMPTFLANPRKDKSAYPATRAAVGPKELRSSCQLKKLALVWRGPWNLARLLLLSLSHFGARRNERER
jgi:hypothetical protein